MKKIFSLKVILMFVYLLAACNSGSDKTISQKPEFKFLWKTEPVFSIPESAIYDKRNEVIYVSNINENPRQKDGNGFISKVSKNGEIINLKWIIGLSSPKGMGISGDLLFVTDTDEIVVIDVIDSMIIKNIPFTDAGMLNDITFDDKGILYVSDMDSNQIWTLDQGEVALWMKDLNKPNGLFYDNGNLIVASFNKGTLNSIDLKTKEMINLVAGGLGKADGIAKTADGSYIVSDWNGELFLFKNGKTISLYDGKKENIQTADICTIEGEGIIIVPTFGDNRLIAFEFSNQ